MTMSSRAEPSSPPTAAHGRRADRGRDDQGDRRQAERRQDARRQRLLDHARRHRSPHPSRHAVHGHDLGRQLRERHKAGARRRHDDGGRFLHPRPRPAADGRARRLGQARRDRRHRLRVPHVHHLLVGQGARGHGQGGRPRRDQLQAFHGLQGLADGQRRGDVRLVLALRRTRRAAAGSCRERRTGRRVAEILPRQGRHRPRGPRLSRPPDVEGEATNRAIMLADQAGVPLYIVHASCIEAHEAIARARAPASGSTASR